MLDVSLRGKKLLLIGGLNNTVDIIDLAHRNGVTVGVADYNEKTYAKTLQIMHMMSVLMMKMLWRGFVKKSTMTELSRLSMSGWGQSSENWRTGWGCLHRLQLSSSR